MNKKVFCTVFTPTYNRAKNLTKLYNSLCEQDFSDFEWLIVDDGSSDDTEKLVAQFIKKHKIEIVYKKTENGGKHRAINYGLDFARGEVFAIVDSDDYLKKDALTKIYKRFKKLPKKNYAGIAFQRGYESREAIGSTFEGEYVDATSLERNKYNISGDKFEIFFTKILQEHKFPEFKGEKFMTEMVVWNRIARLGYKIRWFNDIIYICEYLPDGLTANLFKLYKNNPKGFALNIKEQVQFDNISFKQKMSYYSLYYMIRKEEKNLIEISKEINASPVILLFAYMARMLIWKKR